jgi:hypothetical protein
MEALTLAYSKPHIFLMLTSNKRGIDICISIRDKNDTIFLYKLSIIVQLYKLIS